MASSYKLSRLHMAALLLLTCCLLSLSSLLPSISGAEENETESRKMVLGSRPPRCINRCMNCRPCMAVLVIPPRRLSPKQQTEEENYYLVTWKCRCKNKLFQP